METDAREVPDGEDEPPLVTLGELLRKKISVASLATAIEKHEIWAWDEFGRWVAANEDQKASALRLLAKQQAWADDPERKLREDPRSPLELSEDDFDGPFGHYGWPPGCEPDFESVSHVQIEATDIRAVLQRRAPDDFVKALMQLLVEIAKRDHMLNLNEMPGIKKNLFEVAIKSNPRLDCSFGTFETYIKPFIGFKRGSRSGTYYKNLFPEYFK
ncbi:hypothetical protein [Dechloromonas sp. H13]|uniref:hypothetical protein n=1 Tax=Dechloromonas sp. H13 TaxID=2570193 RepID=UPI001291F201|nr:hypothetical protein [Dechloromonas sp. H13]